MSEHVKRATYRQRAKSPQEDWNIIGSDYGSYSKALPDRVLSHLKILKNAPSLWEDSSSDSQETIITT